MGTAKVRKELSPRTLLALMGELLPPVAVDIALRCRVSRRVTESKICIPVRDRLIASPFIDVVGINAENILRFFMIGLRRNGCCDGHQQEDYEAYHQA